MEQKCIFTVDVEDWFHILDVPSTPKIEEWNNLILEEGINEAGKKAKESFDLGNVFVLNNVHEKLANFSPTWSVSHRRAVGSSETCLPVTSSFTSDMSLTKISFFPVRQIWTKKIYFLFKCICLTMIWSWTLVRTNYMKKYFFSPVKYPFNSLCSDC